MYKGSRITSLKSYIAQFYFVSKAHTIHDIFSTAINEMSFVKLVKKLSTTTLSDWLLCRTFKSRNSISSIKIHKSTQTMGL